MLDLFSMGEYFLSSLKPLGDWLMQPMSEVLPKWVSDLFALSFISPGWSASSVSGSITSMLFGSSEVTVAMWLLGAGLLTIFSFKFVKFVTSIFT
jgi:hypothetical protein